MGIMMTTTNITKGRRRRMERRLILQAIMLLVSRLIRLFGFVRLVNNNVIRRSYMLPSTSMICNDVSDRLLHEPRHYKSSTYYILTYFITSHLHVTYHLWRTLHRSQPII